MQHLDQPVHPHLIANRRCWSESPLVAYVRRSISIWRNQLLYILWRLLLALEQHGCYSTKGKNAPKKRIQSKNFCLWYRFAFGSEQTDTVGLLFILNKENKNKCFGMWFILILPKVAHYECIQNKQTYIHVNLNEYIFKGDRSDL